MPLIIRLWQNINQRRKSQLAMVVGLMIIASVAEVVSIGAVIPFLGVLANPITVYEHELASPFIQYLGVASADELLWPFSIGFSIAAIIAAIMRIVLIWTQTRLAHAIGADLGYQIYYRTLFQPYSVHVSRNSSEVISGISNKANQVVASTIQPLLTITSSLFMIIIIVGGLITLNPSMVFLALAAFSSVYAVFVFFTKNKLLINSRQISKKTDLTIKVMQEGLGGIRDILIDGTQSTYCKIFRSVDTVRRRATANNQIMGQAPRFGVEALGMVLIVFIALYMSKSEDGLENTLPVLGVLAIVAQRMLPMLQQSYASWANLRGAHAILQDALVLIEQPLPKYIEASDDQILQFEKSIIMRDVGFRYSQDSHWVIRHMNIEINKGERVGFIGTTGGGKSTLLDIFMALLEPEEGELAIDNVKLSSGNVRGWQTHISHIPQTIFLSDATVAENIAFGLPFHEIDFDKVRRAARQAQIDDTVMSLNNQYLTEVGERGVRLSGGQRQRIGIARALYKETDVLIFDEATSALDISTENSVMGNLEKVGREVTVIIVAHRLSTLSSCDRIVELENGAIKRVGTYDEIVCT